MDGSAPALAGGMTRRRVWGWLLLVPLLAALPYRPVLGAPEVIAVPAASGGPQLVWFDRPAAPWAAVILFPGGNGKIGIAADASIRNTGNFLVRTRQTWLAQGVAVLIPDVPNGWDDLLNRRSTTDYATDVAALVRLARERTRAPVWLVGTSNGTIAAAAGAARLTRGEIAGVVLSSSVTRLGRQARQSETVFSVPLGDINVPVLIVAHQDDTCVATPPTDAERLRAALRATPRGEVVMATGGLPPTSAPCEARSAHGFLGIETEVVARITGWMRR